MLGSITKENFNHLLSKFSTIELENLIEKHPYFQQAHILLAKKYQQENDPKFDEQLQLAALYSQNREFLFSIFKETDILPSNEIAPLLVPLTADSNIQVPDPLLVFLPTSESPDNGVGDNTNSGIEEEKPVEHSITEETLLTKTAEEFPIAAADTTQETEVTVVSEQTSAPEETPQEVKETFAITEPHTFDEWLSAYSKPDIIRLEIKQEEISADIRKQDEELDQLIMTNSQLHALVEEEANYSKGLDVFIEEQKQKHKLQETRKPADENELASELITETIAKIYEMQKKYPNAIRAYEILALKYPEKNDFFAARIYHLKNIL